MDPLSEIRPTSPLRIVFTAKPGPIRNGLWSEKARARAAELGYSVTLNPNTSPLTEEEWAAFLADADAIITTWGAPCLNEAVLKHNRSLKLVGHAAGSVAGVVSPELIKRGIRVVSANTEMARSVAHWSLMITLASLLRFPDNAWVGKGSVLDQAAAQQRKSTHKAVIGIWGFGAVCKELVNLLRSLKPHRILVSSDYLSTCEADRLQIEKVELDQLFCESDVVHLLEGFTEATRGRIGERQLAALRDGAVLINAGRAPLVDEKALLSHLREQRTRAVLDVHYQEPLPANSVWHDLPNVILTPHCAGWGRNELYVKLVLDEIDRFWRNLPLQHEIFPDRAAVMTDDRLLSI